MSAEVSVQDKAAEISALVWVKCEVAGYLSDPADPLGVMEHRTEEGNKVIIFFHVEDVKIFKKVLRSYGRQMKQVLPVSCLVSCRAERFLSQYIAKAIYCIVWKHQKISQYQMISRYFYDISYA